MVIRRIDTMTLSGYGTEQIADILSKEKVLTPTAYAISKGRKKPSKSKNGDPYNWQSSTIVKILSMQEYCGDIVNFKTYSKSFKNKKRYKNDPENISVFKDVHEPTVTERHLKKFGKSAVRYEKEKSKTANGICFPGCLYVPTVAEICTSISAREIRIFSILTVPNTTKVSERPVHPRTTYVWISWSKSF